MASKKTKEIWEFGDFQTPDELARKTTDVIRSLGFQPKAVLEPTCGRGAFLLTAMNSFPKADVFLGVDVNADHLENLKESINNEKIKLSVRLVHADFFTFNWLKFLQEFSDPILIIGNPPWVTNSELGLLKSKNLPEKSNFKTRSGLDAITGKSNFDISEWMLLQYLEWLKKRNGMVAILCKTAVARKVLQYVWTHNHDIRYAGIYKINALKHFGASVDACFFIMDCAQGTHSKKCDVYETLNDEKPSHIIEFHEGIITSDESLYKRWQMLRGTDKAYKWRSGIKHDCAKVMELKPDGSGFLNGLGELIQLEDKYIFPLLKSSDIGNGGVREFRKFVLVTQKYIGEDTAHIKKDAPNTWTYLQSHSELLGRRASSIYRNRPSFSIFGVGDYTFASWKLAISGFYKRLSFKIIGPIDDRPVMLDDTIYFLPAYSEDEARFLGEIFNSKPALEFFTSMIFWSDKRPITIDLLKRLNIKNLAYKLGRENEYESYLAIRSVGQLTENHSQKPLFPV